MFVRSLEDLRSAGTTSRRAPLGPLASRIIALPRQTSARATEIWAYPGIIGLSLSLSLSLSRARPSETLCQVGDLLRRTSLQRIQFLRGTSPFVAR
jgi:hypothetical protein